MQHPVGRRGGELAVRDHLAARHGTEGVRELPLERRRPDELEADVTEVDGGAGEKCSEPLDGLAVG